MLPRSSDSQRAFVPVDAERRARFAPFELATWALVWVLARSLLVLAFADVFVYGEELQKACAGKAMIDGLAVPHHELAYHYYEGGGFVASHLDALAFLLFGESLLAVKIVALVLGVGVLAAGWRFCRVTGGLTAARVFALLYVLAPDSVQRNSLLALGIHYHALMFVAWILSFTVELAFRRDLRPRIWFLWGLAAGFGLYFSYQCALTIALSVATLILVLRRQLLARATAWSIAGLALGLAPLIAMIASVGLTVFDIHGVDLADTSISKIEIVKQFYLSIFTDRGALDVAAVVIVVLAPLVAVAALVRGAPPVSRSGARLVIAHVILFAASYLGTSLAIAGIYHYILLQRLLPVWFLSLLALALGASAARASPRRSVRWLACACVALPALVGAFDLYVSMQEAARGPWSEHWRELATTKGYAYTGYLEKLSAHLDGTRADKLRILRDFNEPSPVMLHMAIAAALYDDKTATLDDLEHDLDASGSDDRRGFLLGAGPVLTKRKKTTLDERLQLCDERPAGEREIVLEALGRWGDGDPITEDRVVREGNNALEAKMPPAYFRGLGYRIYRASGVTGSRRYFQIRNPPWMLDRVSVLALLAKVPSSVAGELRVGYEAARAEYTLAR